MYIDTHWLYLLAGLVIAGLLYPWSVKRFGDGAGPIARFGFLVIGGALAWPLLLVMFVGDRVDRRKRVRG